MPSQNTYWAMVWRMVDRADVVLEVVDARFPSICRSNRLEQRVLQTEGTGLLVALNKSDLIPRELLQQWITWFREVEGIRAVGVSAKKRLGTSRIRQEILRQSTKKTATVAIVGLPNTGKSSLINTLKGKKSAPTAPVAGHTRALQKIRVSNSLMMFDTPGILPLQLPEKHKLLLGAIAISKLKDPIGAAISLYTQFERLNSGLVNDFYDIGETNPILFLEQLALLRNRLISGGEPDVRMAALMFLKDHMRGKIPIYEDVNHPLRYDDL